MTIEEEDARFFSQYGMGEYAREDGTPTPYEKHLVYLLVQRDKEIATLKNDLRTAENYCRQLSIESAAQARRIAELVVTGTDPEPTFDTDPDDRQYDDCDIEPREYEIDYDDDPQSRYDRGD